MDEVQQEVQQEMSSASRAAQAIRAKFSQLRTIITVLIVLVLITAGAAAILLYLRLTNDPSKNLTFDIPKEIIKKPEVTSNQTSGGLLDEQLVTTYSVDQLERIASSLYPSYSRLPMKYAIDEYTIHLVSRDQNNQPINIRAQIFAPKGAANQEYPLFVFGQGTTGLSDQCAPSKERPESDNWGNYYNHLRTYGGQGFITVFPDYEGFNDDKRIHHYFNAQLESNVLLDATRATLEFFAIKDRGIKAQKAAFYGGYSQGGNAIMAVKDEQPTYAPDVPLKGIVGFGATTNIVNLLKENPPLAPYLFYSYADFYGKDKVNVNQLLQPKWLPTLEKDVLGKCISAASRYYGPSAANVYSPAFYDALFNNKLDSQFPELKKLFDQNSSGTKQSTTPVLIVQGNPDPIVTIQSQEEFIKLACQSGNKITYKIYEGVHHYQTRHVSFKDAIDWMRSVLNGAKVPSVCDNIDTLGTESVNQVPQYENSDVPNVAPPGGSGGG